jgi:glutamate formiminotransferase
MDTSAGPANHKGRLECVINVSEGRDRSLLAELSASAGSALLDVHADSAHHRSVFTLGGPGVEEAARRLARLAVERLDLSAHRGAHPRTGVVDVVPFVPLGWRAPFEGGDLGPALQARQAFAAWMARQLEVPCFLYGPERSLPELRRRARGHGPPDLGPPRPHPTAGATAVGARPLLMAYNLWLARADLGLGRELARDLRSPQVRALAFELDGKVQVSTNLLDPLRVGPAAAYDRVAARAQVERAEVVGLVPARVLAATPRRRWAELGLDPSLTIEARWEQGGLPL